MTNSPRLILFTVCFFLVVLFLVVTSDPVNCRIIPNPLVGFTRTYQFGVRGSTTEPRKRHQGPIPWRDLPQRVKDDYLQNGQIKFIENYFDYELNMLAYPPNWTPEQWEKLSNVTTTLFQTIKNGEQVTEQVARAYGRSHACVIKNLGIALQNKYPMKGKETLVLHSSTPWTENMLIHQDVKSVLSSDVRETTQQNVHAKLSLLRTDKLRDQTFDAIFKFDEDYSGFMHTGLGRYGDYMNPDGDIEMMRNIGKLLKDDGLFFFAIPISQDLLEYNAHRIYGPKRLVRLLEGWKIVEGFPCVEQYSTLELAYVGKIRYSWENQWLFVVQKDNSEGFWFRKEDCESSLYFYVGIAFIAYVAAIYRFVLQKHDTPRLPI